MASIYLLVLIEVTLTVLKENIDISILKINISSLK